MRIRYRDAMARHPETPQEIAEATLLAREAIAEEPWERMVEPAETVVVRLRREAAVLVVSRVAATR